MNKLTEKLVVMVLLATLGGLASCKKNDSLDPADVIGTWAIKSWSWNASEYGEYDMLGTLAFSYSDRGVNFTLAYRYNGIPCIAKGSADLNRLPRIDFSCMVKPPGHYVFAMTFRGFVDGDKMMGQGGLDMYGPGPNYDGWEWEAFKQ